MSNESPADLKKTYQARFGANLAYRKKVWSVLVSDFFQKHVSPNDAVLDLGCGYGEFINAIQCTKKYAMDLNPDAPKYLDGSIRFIDQDCASRWPLENDSLNVVFTSNFFEHLPNKAALNRTFEEALRCLVPGGKLIAMGPNIKFLPGKYWDFWDHHIPLTEASLAEGLNNRGFEIVTCIGKFLPYTMVGVRRQPLFLISFYLHCSLLWRILGKQFLLVAIKPKPAS